MAWKKQYTAEEKAVYQEKKRADMEALFKRIDEGVQQVFTSEKYKDYLKVMSKFTDYSARNTLLIAMQKPDATLVAASGKWKQLGRQVKKGESGIEILAPVAFKTNVVEEIERPVVDEFGNRQYNPDGTEKTEVIQNPVMDVAFKKAYVFDVSQTEGKELPEPVQELTGDFDNDKKAAITKALERVTGIKIKFAEIKGGAKGFYSPTDDKIVVQSNMSDAQTIKTELHECAHKLLHDPSLELDTVKSARNEKEVQAESIAFIIAEKLGIDTSEYSFPYIASWSDGKQLDQLTKVLEDIQQAARKMYAAIESELLKLNKRDLTMDEMLSDTELNNRQKAEILIDECASRGITFDRDEQERVYACAEKNEDISETVKLLSDMEMTYSQKPVDEEAPTDISPEEYIAAMDFDKPNMTENGNKNIIGNTPYSELCKSEVQYFKGLKPRHADNIAKQLEADGISFSGLKKGYSVTITVRKEDVSRYEAAVAKVKASYSKTKSATVPAVYYERPQGNVQKPDIPEKKQPADPKDVPIVTISFVEARQNNRLNELWNSIYASQACRDYIDQHLYETCENRNMKGFVDELEQRFGIERTMYTVAATIQLKAQDGRFTSEIKKQAARFTFDSDNIRLKMLTEQHPIRLNHLFEVLLDRSKELAKEAPLQELPKLPEHLADKFLYSTERVSVKDDYRGIPETSYYNSSVNEYFVEGIGWLDNDAYDREKNLSVDDAKTFYSKVTMINASCINAEGVVSSVDMTRQDYELMTDKTYATENKVELKTAKSKLAERTDNAGIKPKPVEQYAVRQNTNKRYSIVTISADGLITPVVQNISTIAEAKKSMIELYEQRKATTRCELVHPQVLDDKSIEFFKNQPKDLPEITYRVQLNMNKDSPETHFVQQYIKNDDTYKFGEIMAKGDYFSCNAKLAELISEKEMLHKEIQTGETLVTDTKTGINQSNEINDINKRKSNKR